MSEKEHDKIVEQIENKMTDISKFKSEQEKKQKLFEYEQKQLQYHSGKELKISIPNLSKEQVQKALTEIYHFYENTYIQPRKHYKTFENVQDRRLTFQPFILFMKHFKLLKQVFSPDKIIVMFRKHSNYGKYLTLDNFIFLIGEMARQQEAKHYFEISHHRENKSNEEEKQELSRQLFYLYLNLDNPEKYREKLHPIFEPFYCNNKPETFKKDYAYRKFSLPELRKKALFGSKIKDEEKEVFIMKHRQHRQIAQENPFDKIKSVFISWESLRSKSVASLHQNPAELIKRKFVKEDRDDLVYLSEYNSEKPKSIRQKINEKIKKIEQQEQNKNKAILSRIQNKQNLAKYNKTLKIRKI